MQLDVQEAILSGSPLARWGSPNKAGELLSMCVDCTCLRERVRPAPSASKWLQIATI